MTPMTLFTGIGDQQPLMKNGNYQTFIHNDHQPCVYHQVAPFSKFFSMKNLVPIENLVPVFYEPLLTAVIQTDTFSTEKTYVEHRQVLIFFFQPPEG